MTDSTAAELEQLTYEQARTELESVVRQLDDPNLPLDDMMALWERGEALATACESRLRGAQGRFDEVTAVQASATE
jgi:exodeoxyribonuclease VII small subunit